MDGIQSGRRGSGKRRRRLAPALGLAVTLLIPPGCTRQVSLPVPAPIIVVDIDTLRADHLGCYGYARPTTPNLDAFSRESVRFHWAFSQAPNTPPSQTSILTSLYPTSHGRIDDKQVLPEDTVTLAEILSQAGYRTTAFVDGGLMAAEFGLGQGFEIYDDEAGGLAKIDPKVRAWLREHREERFFLLIHSYDVHSPYETTPEPFNSMFLEGLARPSEDFLNHMTQRMEERRLSRYGDNPHALTTVETEYARALYDGGIRHMDDWFGRFMELLKQEGLYQRSIVVFLSDHGDEFEEHDSVFHERIYAAVTRIPLLIRLPDGQFRRRVDAAVEAIDLAPTLLSAVGVEVPAQFQGQDLTPLFGGAGELRQMAVSESPFFGRRVALTTARHRLIYTVRGERRELYDYRRDPLEQRDLAPEHPEIVEQLARGVERWSALVESSRPRAADVARMKDSTVEQLRKLGYLND